MDQIRPFADDRLLVGCLYCTGAADTRDHVPSRVFLDAPYPEQLPVVGACRECNNGLSSDEQYVACLIEATIAGTTDPEKIRRSSVGRILERLPKLRARIEAARTEIGGRVFFAPEHERVRRVVLKLARGHAAFELSLPMPDEPTSVSIRPIEELSEWEREDFLDVHVPEIWPEVGSRAMLRTTILQPELRVAGVSEPLIRLPPLLIQDWLEVQEGGYAYLAATDGSQVRVRMLIGGYIACDVRWESY